MLLIILKLVLALLALVLIVLTQVLMVLAQVLTNLALTVIVSTVLALNSADTLFQRLHKRD